MNNILLEHFNLFIGLIFYLSGLDIVICQDFGYDGNKGPIHWGEQYNTCTGKHQSPININSIDVQRIILPPLKMKGFDTVPDKTTIKNNGHTVMISLDAVETPSISGGPLYGEYEFEQLHFHWGDNDTFGSEDLIDGRSFPMELHMVFYKKAYRNVRSALDYSDGLTVLAFFYDIAPQNNTRYKELSSILVNVTSPNTTTTFEQSPTLSDLLPFDLTHYFTYNGSLTTPPCSEVVTWIDFKDPILLSHEQIEMFRVIRDNEGNHLTHNFRPIQPLGDRVVLYNVENVEDNSLINRASLPIIFPDSLKPVIFHDDSKPDIKPDITDIEEHPPSMKVNDYDDDGAGADDVDTDIKITKTQFEINNKTTDQLKEYTYDIDKSADNKNYVLNEKPNNNIDEEDIEHNNNKETFEDNKINSKHKNVDNDKKSNNISNSNYNVSKYIFIFIYIRLLYHMLLL